MPGRWADLVEQSILHALVAALAVEALLRVWRVAQPEQRLALRLLALVQPVLVSPLLVLVPARAADPFHDRWALFSGRHWEDYRLGPWSLFELFVLAMAVLGSVLFLLDLVPVLRGRRRGRAPGPAPAGLAEEVAGLARAAGIAPPPVRHLPGAAPAVFCAGVRHPAIVVSEGALRLLDPAERRAALAHEVVHLARRDPLVSWLLMAARAACAFNPVAQVLARTMAREAERLADDRGGELAGDRLALASALLKLHRATGGTAPPRALPFAGALAEPLRRARSHDVEVRCRRLLAGEAPPRGPLASLRFALVAAALPGLLWFVT